MSDIKKGDIVMLKSGGPDMTVASGPFGNHNDCYKCFWFHGTDIKHEIFDTAALKKVTATD